MKQADLSTPGSSFIFKREEPDSDMTLKMLKSHKKYFNLYNLIIAHYMQNQLFLN